jgi:DNA-binding LacI/PurR family transcriptional regulator
LSYCSLHELTGERLRSFAAEPGAAVFCSNDQGALQIWHRACEQGIGVPGTLRVAGFDGETQGRALGLTSVLFDGDLLGREAFTALQHLVKDPSVPVRVSIPARLLPGRST